MHGLKHTLGLSALLLFTSHAFAQVKDPLLTSPATQPTSTSDENAPVVMMRSSPKIYEVEFEVMVGSQGAVGQNGSVLWQLGPTTFTIPLIHKGTNADLDPSFGGARVWIEGKEVPSAQLKIVMHPTHAGATKVDVGMPSANCTSIRVNVLARMQLWDIEIDEAAARKITWPREWPEDTRAFLAEDDFIHPSDPLIAAFVQQTTKGNLRGVAPYDAAKELVLATLKNFRQYSTQYTLRGWNSSIRGLNFGGNFSNAAMLGNGTSVDAALSCVAVLRNAGIPARVVYGGTRENGAVRGGERSSATTYMTWCEFYLPTAGWIPFDPGYLKSRVNGTMDLSKSWKGFGNMDWLDEWVPYSYAPIPRGSNCADWPALWGWSGPSVGWTPQNMVNNNARSAITNVTLRFTSRGKGKVDREIVPRTP